MSEDLIHPARRPLSGQESVRLGLHAEPGVDELARDPRLALLGDRRVDLPRDLRVRVTREHRCFCEA
jgi:hypothetical protein